MKKFLMALAALLLAAAFSACTTMGDIQGPCYSKYKVFSEVSACIRTELPRIRSHSNWTPSEILQYETYLDSLEEMVKNKEISDAQAKLRLQEYYMQVRAAK